MQEPWRKSCPPIVINGWCGSHPRIIPRARRVCLEDLYCKDADPCAVFALSPKLDFPSRRPLTLPPRCDGGMVVTMVRSAVFGESFRPSSTSSTGISKVASLYTISGPISSSSSDLFPEDPLILPIDFRTLGNDDSWTSSFLFRSWVKSRIPGLDGAFGSLSLLFPVDIKSSSATIACVLGSTSTPYWWTAGRVFSFRGCPLTVVRFESFCGSAIGKHSTLGFSSVLAVLTASTLAGCSDEWNRSF
mmetsp:Transcript_11432/g.24111  ORF Transcript_11432/g.24111 Transcript_11432/m.24111 type:complete len:246 (-) Transcript_11432:889-1626(-)